MKALAQYHAVHADYDFYRGAVEKLGKSTQRFLVIKLNIMVKELVKSDKY